MTAPLDSLIQCGTKLWLDSVDPNLTSKNYQWGVTGATSNPIIIAELIRSGRFDSLISGMAHEGYSADHVTWHLTDYLVAEAEKIFLPVFGKTKKNDGYVSFELDPLLEDVHSNLTHAEKVSRYVQLAKKWSDGHPNRMIKVPATPAGIDSLSSIAAMGIPLNVTLIFSDAQYEKARNAVWQGAQTLKSWDGFKSVYSIFVSRIDVYVESKYQGLSPQAQGFAGILNAKMIWQKNQEFWKDKKLPLEQEIVFASTGTKKPSDQPWKYVVALAGADIQTNPPSTNDAVAGSDVDFVRTIDQFPAASVVGEIQRTINWSQLEADLMSDGLKKFSDPQHALIGLVEKKILAFSSKN
jgi:transaldolase